MGGRHLGRDLGLEPVLSLGSMDRTDGRLRGDWVLGFCRRMVDLLLDRELLVDILRMMVGLIWILVTSSLVEFR